MSGANRAGTGTDRIKEPFHLMAVRLPIYAGAAVLAVGPIAPGAGLTAALVGVVAGLWAGRFLAASRLRGVTIAVASLIVAGLGYEVDRLVGGPAWFVGLLGYRGALTLIEVLTFGLMAAGLVAGVRALATRHPSWGGAEAVAVALIVVGTFAGHRDAHLGRPQFLSDWALSRGQDTVQMLLGAGLTAALACALLLLRPQRAGRTIASVLALVGLAALLLVVGWRSSIVLPGTSDVPEVRPIPAPPKPESPPDSDSSPPPDPAPKPVAIVNFLDDLKMIPGYFYFRGQALSRVEGIHLVPAGSPYDADVPGVMPTARAEFAAGEVQADEKLFQEVRQRISMLIDDPRPFGMVTMRLFEPKAVADPNLFRRTYHATSRVPSASLAALARRKAGDPAWPSEVRAHYLVESVDPRYKALAETIVAGIKPEYRGSPSLKALALVKWIEAKTTYTKHPEPSADPTAAFLFDGKPGKCTEVAHAMVFMLRSLGVPARAASGFAAPGGRMGTGSVLMLQHTDAHQWCEVYFEGMGWVVVDVSPERKVTRPDPEPDPATQSRFGEKNREPEEKVIDKMRDDEKSTNQRAWAAAVGSAAGISLLVPLLAALAIKAWRRLAPRWVPASRIDRVGYRAVLDRLAEVGLTRGFGETRDEFANRVARIVPEFVEATAAFDRRILTGEGGLARAAWLELDSRLSNHLAETFTARRRLLGLADPLAWRRSR